MSNGVRRATTWQCQGLARNRKEIVDVTDAEFAKFADALNTLKISTDWDRLVFLHVRVGNTAHNDNRFLHWHRKYLYDVETMLQAAADSCDVTMPYWNWALDVGDAGAEQSAVWGPTRYGSLDPESPNRCVPQTQWGSWCFPGRAVTDGAFGAGSPFENEPLLRNHRAERVVTAPDGGVFTIPGRQISTMSVVNLNDALELEADNTSTAMADVFPQNNAAGPPGIVSIIERQFHNSVHCAVGGHMCSFLSPYDPVFFAHHAFVDYIFKTYQDTHLDVEGDERYWTANRPEEDWGMITHVCNWQTQWDVVENRDVIPAVEVEVSQHMTGSMNGVVDYKERSSGMADDCENWEAVSCCMRAVSLAGKWHDVTRVQAGADDVSDMCSPMNPLELAHTNQWLVMLRDLGHMSQEEVDTQLERQSNDLKALENAPKLSFDDYQSTSTCEQRLCIAIDNENVETSPFIHNLKGVCTLAQHNLPEGERCGL